MLPVKLVTFDITGTVLFFRTPIYDKYIQTALKFGVKPDPEILKKNFQKAWKTLNQEYPNFGKVTGLDWQNWWYKFVERTFDTYVEPENKRKIQQIYDDLLDFHTKEEAFTIRPGTEDLFGFLKSKNVKLGVISNYDPRLHQILQLTNLRKYFDFVLVSYDFGYAKPDRRIFEEALKLGNCSSGSEGGHVGDDVETDYLGAKQAGMRAILMCSDVNSVKNGEVDRKDVYTDFYKLKADFEKVL